MHPLLQFLLSALAGVVFLHYLVGRDYWRGFGWLIGRWDPNLGHASEDALITSAHRMMALMAALLLGWAIAGPSPYRDNWEMEVMGLAAGMLVTYVVIIARASVRAAGSPR
ncbi:hypothetical protein [Stenotrophomonas sp. ZAC14D2_NAIMI4_6]|uniref:hypothetical protein n=1 Tax=Stenotrophomonas sp. ZAC14D2_NAIMI4_6 TaxID=2072406 RepID=UPI000D53FDDB|nr:hypothetical protein [Stenotrophomonas sp. ZAC14D2_NAIMI4_6]AWH19892.1 hypothetical protein C1933_00805 [Stenotrophomonas sp. ZAC14D2_NAIMI4_6]